MDTCLYLDSSSLLKIGQISANFHSGIINNSVNQSCNRSILNKREIVVKDLSYLALSSYLDKVMTPMVKSLPSHIKDSNHALEIFRTFNFTGENKIIFIMGVQRWRSGESTRLPPIWTGFNSQIRSHMWVECVGSPLCPEIFSPENPVFPSPQKPAFFLICVIW